MFNFNVIDYVSPECLRCSAFKEVEKVKPGRQVLRKFAKIIASGEQFQQVTGRPVSTVCPCGCSYNNTFPYLLNHSAYAVFPGPNCINPWNREENKDCLKACCSPT